MSVGNPRPQIMFRGRLSSQAGFLLWWQLRLTPKIPTAGENLISKPEEGFCIHSLRDPMRGMARS